MRKSRFWGWDNVYISDDIDFSEGTVLVVLYTHNVLYLCNFVAKKKYFQVRDFVVVRNGYVLMHVLRLH